jgi:CRISPR system Cascade subunit CasD
MHRYLVLRLEAPLLSFGGEAIDNLGVIRPFPAKSMIAGMLANAVGAERYEYGTLQALQDKLVMGSRIQRTRRLVRDFQTAELSRSDQGWTAREQVEGRRGGTASYLGPHLRHRDYWTNAEVSVVFRVLPESPFTLEELENALQHPARPLFLGRKACIPSGQIYNGDVRARSAFEALIAILHVGLETDFSLQWPAFDTEEIGSAFSFYSVNARLEPVCDERNWITGVHTGERFVRILDLNENVWAAL